MNTQTFTARITHPKTLAGRLRTACTTSLLPLLLLLVLPAAVQAQFLYTITNGTVTITGYTGPGGAVVIPSKINGLPVTSIGAEAFQYCTSLTDITIPYSVTNIGVAAFWRCTSLKAITVDTDNPAYSSADGVLFDKSQTTLVECPGGKAGAYSIRDSVTSIADLSFSFCTSLTSITIPNGVTSIGYETFWSCTSLTSITIADSVTSIGDLAFSGCSSVTNIAIPTSVNRIPDEAFSGCFSLTSVTIPNSVTDIGDDAFSYCFSLSIVTIPNSVTNIGTNAFSHGGLTLVTIGDGVNSIRDGAFSAGGLNAVIFQGNAPSLGSGVFYTNNNTATVYYMPGTAGWGPTFGGLPTKLWNPETQFSYTTTNGTITITGYTGPGPGIAVTIPDTINGVPVTNIGDDAFFGGYRLSSVTIPNSVTNIGNEAFANCGSLTSVTIPNSLVRVGSGAFGACARLTSVTIPNSVISIGDSAFVACSGLTNVTIGSGATSIGDGAFGLCTRLPSISVDALNSAYSSVDGVLFNKTQTTLVQYPGGIAAPSYTIPNSVTTIGDWSFANCPNLKSVTIPNSITSIEDDAFWNTGLTNVTIVSGATSIGVGAFGDCTSLTSISVDTLNSTYSSVDGVLFNKTQTALVQYPAGVAATSYMIPDGVAAIGYLAFAHCTNLTSVTIANSVTSIADHAFWNSSSLTNVTIGNGVTSVGSRAFIECTSLLAVYFQGNAPSLVGTFPFDGDNNATVYYLPGTTGWGATFGGLPTALWSQVPTIQKQPQSLTAEVGSAVGFRVRASSPLPLFYFWYLNATNLLSSGTNWQLELTNLQLSQSGAYNVVISNVLGPVASTPAMLNVIAAVERRPVPGLQLMGEAGGLLNLDVANPLSSAPDWLPLDTVTLASTPQYYFDLTVPLPAQRFYRAWQTGAPGVRPSLELHMVPAITLTGSIGHLVRVDAINQFGPIDAWVTLDAVPLTNTSQLYFDISAPGKPQRLYRLVPSP